MGSGVSDYGASQWLGMLFDLAALPPGYWVALSQGEPGPGMTGSDLAGQEPESGGYARQPIDNGSTAWALDDSGYLTNTVVLDYGVPADDWLLNGQLFRVTHWVLCSAAAAGEIYAWGELSDPQPATSGFRLSIPAGGVVLALTSLDSTITL